jgi:hypothetical protein
MQKWTNSGAGPIQCKRFSTAWSKLNWEHNTFVELIGIVGGQESRSVLTTICGGNMRADVTAAQETIGQRFNWTITAANVNDITKAAEAELTTLQANRPIQDNRRTPDAEAERRAAAAKMEAEHKARGDRAGAAFVSHYGSGEKVTIQPGQTVITAQICFDNSDSMTDYFDRVIMNPPFEKQADIDHVRKAFSVLKPHGILVSVMAPGFEFRQDRKSTEFRAWLNNVGGIWEALPDGAFKTSGTGIGTRLVVIEKAAA